MKLTLKMQTTHHEPKARQEAPSDARQMTWILAALFESLVLVGGMLWVLNGPAGVSLPLRILLVVALAVLGAGGFALAAAHRLRD